MTAMDAVEETIDLSREKNSEAKIDFVTADIFEWRPTGRYDFIFFGFWLSHVPAERFDAFWEKLEKVLQPGGRVFFVDSLKAQSATAHGHQVLDDSGVDKRSLNSGETFRIVKYFYEPETIEEKLRSLGWSGEASRTEEFFVYGAFQKS
ncbi:class I SAM-dependent methyltransferase [Verrucomicrobiales bacterium]|jgi:2-polyprenyl-3-methyl-5-hydroxy-6-metoxy-1,4-benzoquinol methylase|nr:class I SAM-dependent methyltransferase [Verrucomicrobiales bacterium]